MAFRAVVNKRNTSLSKRIGICKSIYKVIKEMYCDTEGQRYFRGSGKLIRT